MTLTEALHGARQPLAAEVDRTADYVRNQDERTLTLAIWITMGTSAGLAVVGLVFDDRLAVISLVTLAALCPVLLELGARGRVPLAGALLPGLVLAVATLHMIAGDGLRDPGAVAYPIVVTLGGYLLGKRALPYLVLGTVTGLSSVLWLGLHAGPASALADGLEDYCASVLLLGATALLIWIYMDNAQRNLLRIRSSESEVLRAYEDTLEAWARALEYRDRETEGHSRRVTELGVRLARVLGLGEDEVMRIRWGALLHDVGKLAIPDSILLKPGPLTEIEKALMERHTDYAREILSRIPFLHPVIAIPYHHHERWDGTGYPERLAGAEIPLAARIFTVVDQWEALTSDRPYRRAWPRERVVSYLRSNAGRIFDPEIVEVFLGQVVAGGAAAQEPSESSPPRDGAAADRVHRKGSPRARLIASSGE